MEFNIILASVCSPGFFSIFSGSNLIPSVSVIVQVSLTFQGIVTQVTWPPAGLFLDLEPRVHVIFEEPFVSGQEMPHFVYADDCVSLLNSLEEFWNAPGPYELALQIRVRVWTFPRSRRNTEWKGEFASVMVR